MGDLSQRLKDGGDFQVLYSNGENALVTMVRITSVKSALFNDYERLCSITHYQIRFIMRDDLPQIKLILSCSTERRRAGLIQQLDGLTIQV